MTVADFNTDFQFSLGEREQFDISILQRVISKCVTVEKTTEELDRKGIDYIATLENGAEIYIDAKTRRTVRCVDGSPELALEIWSVKPTNGNKGKIGWTLNTETNVDMILYTFPKDKWEYFYLIPFQFLRMAFQANGREWMKKYRRSVQENGTWQSECMFVPAHVVLDSVSKQMSGAA